MLSEKRQLENRFKWATFPFQKTLDEFNLNERESLIHKHLNRLKDLTWIEQLHNIILLGSPGSDKIYISIRLGIKELHQRHKVILTTISNLIHVLKQKKLFENPKLE